MKFPLARPSWPATVPRDPPRRSVGVDYTTDWARRYPARVARVALVDFVARPIVTAVATPEIAGRERIEHLDGPLIFVANHMSHVDTPLLLSSLPPRFRHRAVVAAAADYFFDHTWKGALWAFALGAIPLERTRPSRRSADLAASLIAEGWNLVIFPEGGRSPDGWGQQLRAGAAYLSARTAAPVVPVHLGGTRAILAKGSKRFRPGRTTVTFGAPIVPEEGSDARRLAAHIADRLAELSDGSGPDWWQARRRAAEGATPPLTGPDLVAWRRAWARENGRRVPGRTGRQGVVQRRGPRPAGVGPAAGAGGARSAAGDTAAPGMRDEAREGSPWARRS